MFENSDKILVLALNLTIICLESDGPISKIPIPRLTSLEMEAAFHLTAVYLGPLTESQMGIWCLL